MPPATATSMSPTLDGLVGEHHRLQPGAAHLVDRQRGDMIRQAAVERRLPRRILAEPGADDVAHDAFVDDLRIDAGAPHGFGDDQRTELRRGEAFERAEKLAGRRADGGDDDGFTHGRTSMRSHDVRRRGAICRRRRITGDERITSFDHCALAVSTSSTRCSSLTWVTRSNAGPTAAFHAKSPWRRRAASRATAPRGRRADA